MPGGLLGPYWSVGFRESTNSLTSYEKSRGHGQYHEGRASMALIMSSKGYLTPKKLTTTGLEVNTKVILEAGQSDTKDRASVELDDLWLNQAESQAQAVT